MGSAAARRAVTWAVTWALLLCICGTVSAHASRRTLEMAEADMQALGSARHLLAGVSSNLERGLQKSRTLLQCLSSKFCLTEVTRPAPVPVVPVPGVQNPDPNPKLLHKH